MNKTEVTEWERHEYYYLRKKYIKENDSNVLAIAIFKSGPYYKILLHVPNPYDNSSGVWFQDLLSKFLNLNMKYTTIEGAVAAADKAIQRGLSLKVFL
jgi:hypothetical protein